MRLTKKIGMPFFRAVSIAAAQAGTVAAAPAMQCAESGVIKPFSISIRINADLVLFRMVLFPPIFYAAFSISDCRRLRKPQKAAVCIGFRYFLRQVLYNLRHVVYNF